MEVIHGLEKFPRQRVPIVLALGTFDGVHRGHQALLQETVTLAAAQGGRAAAITFDPHPLTVIAPPPESFLLTTLEERLGLMAGAGIDLTVVITFDTEFRLIPAQEWVALLERHVGMRDLVCGTSYTFGHDRRGTVDLLGRWAADRAIRLRIIPPVHIGGTVVSSTLIRRLLRAGDVREAARYLGRWYAVSGTVEHGDGRGRSLGFPTANVAPPEEKLLPAQGIYAAIARTAEGSHPAAVSYGTRPTFGPGRPVLEAHLLDFAGELHGRALDVHFVQRLRDETAFMSEAALIRQIRDDVAETRRIVAEASVPAPARSP